MHQNSDEWGIRVDGGEGMKPESQSNWAYKGHDSLDDVYDARMLGMIDVLIPRYFKLRPTTERMHEGW